MICKLCGRDVIEKINCKKGYICQDCFNKLPHSFQNSINKLTVEQLRKSKEILHRRIGKPWAVCESFGLCDKSVQLGTFEVALTDIDKIHLNFHPLKKGGGEDLVYGIITIVINTIEPKMRIEEPLLKTEVKYYISGKNISYVFPHNIALMINNIQVAIDRKIYDSTGFKPAKEKAREEREKAGDPIKRKNRATEFALAKKLFGVEIPYTKEEIIEKKRTLLKKFHPDNGGSVEETIKINKAYEVLEKYVS